MNKEKLDHILEKSFREEPDFQLPADFAQKLTQFVTKREQWKSDLKEYFLLTAVLLGLLLIVAGFYFFIDQTQAIGTIPFISENILPIMLIVLILNFILFADRVLLRLLFNRWNK